IMQAMGGTPPEFAHHSLLTGPQGEALSKRLGTLSLRDLRAQGIEPLALLSMMARLGSSKPIELASSMQDLINGFDIGSFGAAPTKFDADDLFPLTRAHVQALPYAAMADQIANLGVPAELAEQFWAVARENITVKADLKGWWAMCRDGADPVIAPEDAEFVAQALTLLPPRPWGATSWSDWTNAVKAATGRKGKGLFMPLRRAVTGQDHGPDMASLMPLLQKVRTAG
ncbi:MAG: glutamate--tRNA ligase family protein, partial [Gemmobacter sp.]|nr:glutamate--tRNA ligase family protein [Gemmobacter sp.]